MNRPVSALERARAEYRPTLPKVLRGGIGALAIEERSAQGATVDAAAIRERFPATFGRPAVRFVPGGGPPRRRPLRVGVLLSGGQAPGGHNVLCGLFDALRAHDRESRLYGFLGGPRGLFEARSRELDLAAIDPIRNTGGFDRIGSGRDKIETPEQFARSRAVCDEMELDGLVIVGGDDSNTNAAALAEQFLQEGCATIVVGVPKTIDGDLRGAGLEMSFGFDTATRVYSELIGNIARDSRSAGKYWHFIRLMGRSASHVTLECALQTHPNLALIGEEVRANDETLATIVERIADLVRRRAESGRRYGVCLVPEGLIEFVPEIGQLIDELNTLLARGVADGAIGAELSDASAAVFGTLPEGIRRQLLLDRDSHGNVQVSKIDTEGLLVAKVAERLEAWKREGRFAGPFGVQGHFFGYEGRCAAPTNFDSDYTYALGTLAAGLVAFERTGYLCTIGGLAGPAVERSPAAVPLTSLMRIESRKGRPVPVIAKALVDLTGPVFGEFAARRAAWELDDDFVYPGAIQYFGPPEVSSRPPLTLQLEQGGR